MSLPLVPVQKAIRLPSAQEKCVAVSMVLDRGVGVLVLSCILGSWVMMGALMQTPLLYPPVFPFGPLLPDHFSPKLLLLVWAEAFTELSGRV